MTDREEPSRLSIIRERLSTYQPEERKLILQVGMLGREPLDSVLKTIRIIDNSRHPIVEAVRIADGDQGSFLSRYRAERSSRMKAGDLHPVESALESLIDPLARRVTEITLAELLPQQPEDFSKFRNSPRVQEAGELAATLAKLRG